MVIVQPPPISFDISFHVPLNGVFVGVGVGAGVGVLVGDGVGVFVGDGVGVKDGKGESMPSSLLFPRIPIIK